MSAKMKSKVKSKVKSKAVSKNKKPDILEAFIVDVNGVLRGKRIPAESFGKVFKGALRLPFSAFAVDIWGQDVLSAGLVVETGDSDGVCLPDPDSLKPVPWATRPTSQVLLSMFLSNGRPFFGDPRHVLKGVLDRYKKLGLRPVVATELEFYLFDPKRGEYGAPLPPRSSRTGKRHHAPQVYGIGEMQEFDEVLSEIVSSCKKQGVPTDTAISENGPGQYEINLPHAADALAIADRTVLMKRAVRGVARKHGLDATFMAKPYADKSGSGMHVHFSVIDKNGRNVFSGKDEKGSDVLRHALGGLMKTMAEGMAVFAPNANSYRRFRVGSHAPTRIAWGYDNRSASLRVPASDIAGTRIEHRVSGADANPYLLLAVMLAGALYGIEHRIDPGAPITGNAYQSKAKVLPRQWDEALDLFEGSAFIAEYLGAGYRKLYAACKRQEKEQLESQVSSLEYDAYLGEV